MQQMKRKQRKEHTIQHKENKYSRQKEKERRKGSSGMNDKNVATRQK
jgi:hypothetical protein